METIVPPSDGVTPATLVVFLRHSGWHRFTVDAQPYGEGLQPVKIPAPARGEDRTGELQIKVAFSNGEPWQEHPLFLRAQDTSHGLVTFRVPGNGTTRLPAGGYSVMCIQPHVVGLLDLPAGGIRVEQGATTSATLMAREPLRGLRLAYSVRDGAGGVSPYRGMVQLAVPGRVLGSFPAQTSPQTLWVPEGPVTCKGVVSVQGKNRVVEATVEPEADEVVVEVLFEVPDGT